MILQTQYSHPDIDTQKKAYSGLLNCVKRVSQEQGIRSLWKGNFTNVLRYFPTQALNFAFKERFKKLFEADSSIFEQDFGKKLVRNMLAGGSAGATSMLFVYPLDLARTRITSDTSNRIKGIAHCLKSTLKFEGPFGLYRGILVSMIGIFPYRAVYFGLYDTAKAYMGKNILVNFFVANCVTATANHLVSVGYCQEEGYCAGC